jgi:2-dehydropantoate 2-reductase
MKEQEQNLAALTDFLDLSGIEYEVCPDIRRAMWNKFMINVGINQTCMVYETNYGGATDPDSRACKDMEKAMHEVIAVAKAEGIVLTEEDFEKDMEILRGLNPEGTPSMRQDALAGRPSEVELFAGTMLRLAAQHGIDVPVNRQYHKRIREMERGISPVS